MKKFAVFASGIIVAALVFVASAYTLNVETGEGFVGKGEVQAALGLNNAQLQSGNFTFSVVSVQETTWECLNRGGNEVERQTTVITQGVLSSTARERNQITGFILDGYDGDPTVTTDGNEPGWCPTGQTFIEGSISVGEASTTTLKVNGVELQ